MILPVRTELLARDVLRIRALPRFILITFAALMVSAAVVIGVYVVVLLAWDSLRWVPSGTPWQRLLPLAVGLGVVWGVLYAMLCKGFLRIAGQSTPPSRLRGITALFVACAWLLFFWLSYTAGAISPEFGMSSLLAPKIFVAVMGLILGVAQIALVGGSRANMVLWGGTSAITWFVVSYLPSWFMMMLGCLDAGTCRLPGP